MIRYDDMQIAILIANLFSTAACIHLCHKLARVCHSLNICAYKVGKCRENLNYLATLCVL